MTKKTDLVQTFLDDLPPGWSLATIRDLVSKDGVFKDGDWVESKDQDPNGDVRLIQLADIGDGRFRDRSSRFLTYEKAIKLRCTFLNKGDVLVARMPDPLGRACIFPGDNKKAVTVVDVCVVRPADKVISIRWLMYFINAPAFRIAVASLQTGSTRKRISRKNLARLSFPVPPPNEQKLIVAEIEKQFSRLDEAVENLKRVKANLKRYKASVLKAAVEGKLTEEWRKKHPDVEPADKLLGRILVERRKKWEEAELAKMKAKGKEPKDDKWKKKYKLPDDADHINIDLPEGWVIATVKQLSERVQYGSSSKTNEDSDGITVIRMGNIFEGKLLLGKLKYLPKSHGEFPELLLKSGDLLFNRTNSPELVGKTAVYKGEPSPCSFASYLIRACLIDGVDPNFICYVINSNYGRQWIKSVVSQQVGQANVNGTKLQALSVPLPPHIEQSIIVSEVESKFSIIDELEMEVDRNLIRGDRLRQSILKKAFSGQLIPSVEKYESETSFELPMAAESTAAYGAKI